MADPVIIAAYITGGFMLGAAVAGPITTKLLTGREARKTQKLLLTSGGGGDTLDRVAFDKVSLPARCLARCVGRAPLSRERI